MNELQKPVLSCATPAAEKLAIENVGTYLDSNNFSGECIDFLLNVLERSVVPENRIKALQILQREARRRNSNLAMPRSITSRFNSAERECFQEFTDRMAKLQNRSTIVKFPNHQYEFSDLVSFAHTYFKPESEKFIDKNTAIAAIGSCFAGNVTNYLKNKGYNAWNVEIGELVNNSYNNLWLLTNIYKVASGQTVSWGEGLPAEFTERCEQLRERLTTATCVIFTVGLSLAFVDSFGKVRAEPLYSFTRDVYTGLQLTEIPVEENTKNLVAIYDLMKDLNPKAKVVFTLSPIPLDGIIDETASVVELDCISKSIGRVSLSALKRLRPECIYFPSYELVRWVACNQPMPLYGGDIEDQNTRHVTRKVIADIMTIFESFYVVGS